MFQHFFIFPSLSPILVFLLLQSIISLVSYFLLLFTGVYYLSLTGIVFRNIILLSNHFQLRCISLVVFHVLNCIIFTFLNIWDLNLNCIILMKYTFYCSSIVLFSFHPFLFVMCYFFPPPFIFLFFSFSCMLPLNHLRA